MHAALKTLAERLEEDIRRDMEGDRLVWPSIPRLVVRIRQVLEKEDATVAEMTAAISNDPAVAAQLLKVANSVYYGTEPCRTLRAAVVRLGADALQNVVLMAVVSRVFAVGKRKEVQPLLVGGVVVALRFQPRIPPKWISEDWETGRRYLPLEAD